MKFFLIPIIIFVSCNSPSSSDGAIINRSKIYEVNTDCYDVDVNDSYIVLSASSGGYHKIPYELDSNGFPSFVDENIVVENDPNGGEFFYSNISRSILSDDEIGTMYLLDKTPSPSGVFFDNLDNITTEPQYFVNDCYQSKFLDIVLDESEPDLFDGLIPVHGLYFLLKHQNLNDDVEESQVYQQYSNSIAATFIQVEPVETEDDGTQQVPMVIDECTYLWNIPYYSNEMHFGDNRIAVANDIEGVIVFKRNGYLSDFSATLDSLFSFNIPVGKAQSVYSLDDAIIGGFSDDKGCYMALLDSDDDVEPNYIAFAEGYSVNDIDYDNGIIGLATGSDGVQLYFWNGSSVSPYGWIDTEEYAFGLKIKDGIVYVATEMGLEIYKIGS